MEGIGDRDVKMSERYVKRRTGRTARSLKSLDREEGQRDAASARSR